MTMVTTSEIIKSYKTFLNIKKRAHYRRFCDLLNNNPESARAEAIVFSIMRTQFHDVIIEEDIGIGGPDFRCISDNEQFILEVTCLEAEAVAAQSGWAKNATGGSFGMVTHQLKRKVSNKAGQLSGYPMPRVLAITTEHIAANVLFGQLGAESLLASDTMITVPIGQPIENSYLTTDSKNSGFFEYRSGQLEPRRCSISAMLLVGIYADKSVIVGILHPAPAYTFPISLLPSVPFFSIKKWAPEKNNIETEWVNGESGAADFYHTKVK